MTGDSRRRVSPEPGSTREPCLLSTGSNLFLEEILKCLPRIAGPLAGRSGGFFFVGYANFIKRTIIARVFFRDAILNRLHAFKPGSRIKVHALFAGVQFESAFWALPAARHPLQHRPTLGAPGDGASSRHVDWPRSECVVSFRRRRSTRPLSRTFSVFIPILVSRLTVFRHRNTSPKHAAYCAPDSHGTASTSGSEDEGRIPKTAKRNGPPKKRRRRFAPPPLSSRLTALETYRCGCSCSCSSCSSWRSRLSCLWRHFQYSRCSWRSS